MESLPRVIEDIIMSYVNQLNHYEKFKHVLNDIKSNIDVEYHIPYWEAEAGYIVKTTKYKKEHFKRFRSIICHHCGRDIKSTEDEYAPEYATENYSIDTHLHSINKSIMKDMYKGKCETFTDYIESKYYELRDEICEEQNNLVIGVVDADGNQFDVLIDIDVNTDDEIEDIDTEDDDEMMIELTQSEVEDLIEEIDEMNMLEEYEEMFTSEDEDSGEDTN